MGKVVAAAVVTAVIALLAWLTVAWVPGESPIAGWSTATGVLRVVPPGLAVVPRWRFTRLRSAAVEAGVEGGSAEGVRVEVAIRLTPPAGSWRLAPAADVAEGLALAAEDSVRSYLGAVPIGCLAGGSRGPDCPEDAGGALRSRLAERLGVPASALEVALEPDADGLRAFLLGNIRARLAKPSGRVLVIGLDAVDWDLVLPFVRSGRMPNLARLQDAGTWGDMETIVPFLSPLIWTTMATGTGPEEHGILDFVEKDPKTGAILPVSGRGRKVPAIWNAASALGLKADVVGWWATWPAERVSGTMVSDRLYYTLTQGIDKEVLRTDPPGMVFPEETTTRFAELRDRASRSTDWRVVRQYLDISEQEFAAAQAGDPGWENPVEGVRRLIAATDTYCGAAAALAEGRPQLLMLYVEGTDEIGHVLAPYMPPPLVDVEPARAAAYAAAVPRYFAAVDRWIGRLLEQCPLEECAVLVLSDHGFKWGEERPTNISSTAGPTAPLWHDPNAIFTVAGKGIRRLGRTSARVTVYDVAPTIASLLGIPPDQSWRGRPFPGAPDNGLAPIDYRPLLPAASYRSSQSAEAVVDPEYIAKLESLGYISRSGGEQDRPSKTPGPSGRSPGGNTVAGNAPEDPSSTRGSLNNLAVIKINEKRYDEAEALLRKAIEASPDYAAPRYNLRRIYMETGRYDDADRELWAAVDRGLRDPERSLDRAAADYESLSMPERADALLARSLERFPDHEPFWVHALVVKLRLEQCVQGTAMGIEAMARFPSSAPVHAFSGLLAVCSGDHVMARGALQRSLQLKPDQPTLRETLSRLPSS